MKNVIFENDGELDVRCISTFGCSVKTTENPIGFFGTGLKCALAVLLRQMQNYLFDKVVSQAEEISGSPL